jgi:hypothetical protein
MDDDRASLPPPSRAPSVNASRSTSLARSSRGGSPQPDNRAAAEKKRIRNRYAEILNIPQSLMVRENIDLTLAWAKWEYYHKVRDVMNELRADEDKTKWDHTLKGGTELIDVFLSKTVWYAYYSKQFPRVYAFPQVQKWLSMAEDAPSGLDLFGIEKAHYSFSDLKDLLDELEEEKEKEKGKKGKDKEKEKVKEKKASSSKKDKGKNLKTSDESDDSRSKKKAKSSHKKHSHE